MDSLSNRDAHQKFIFCKEAPPNIVEQHSIGLESIVNAFRLVLLERETVQCSSTLSPSTVLEGRGRTDAQSIGGSRLTVCDIGHRCSV